ncbi:MAG: AAA family ATPase [Oscillospiraceae bacterium]
MEKKLVNLTDLTGKFTPTTNDIIEKGNSMNNINFNSVDYTGDIDEDDYDYDPIYGCIADEHNNLDAALNSSLINYNEAFKNDAPIMFRDDVIYQTLSCLIGKTKPNALLVGAAGVGKTKIVEELARRLANNDMSIPDTLAGYTVYELPLSSIVSGSGMVGDIERKTKAILDFAGKPENKVILFIDEIHTLISGNPTYDKIAQLMKPALARGNVKVIGATTLQESQNLLNDPAFNRRFSRFVVDELTKEQTKAVLSAMKGMMSAHYCDRVLIPDKLLDEIIAVSDEYKTAGSHRPDTAITLLDRAMADAFIQMNHKQASASRRQAALKTTKAKTILSKEQLIATAMKNMTGNSKRLEPDIRALRKRLQTIKGQDEALECLIEIVERDSLGIFPRTRPITLLFAGNSGVGKSETAKILARELMNENPIILNMTEYNNSASINKLVGSPVGYIGSDSKAELPFDILESNPYQVIILDEFEKCAREVQRLFMSAFDEGYIKTARGKIVDFSKSIIIATTNAGYTNKSDAIGFAAPEHKSQASVTDLTSGFDLELLNRFTKVMFFNGISKDKFTDILADVYKREVKDIKSRFSEYSFLPDVLDKDTLEALADEYYVKQFGARPAGNAIRKYIEDIILNYKKSEQAPA